MYNNYIKAFLAQRHFATFWFMRVFFFEQKVYKTDKPEIFK